jgi:hypothetical protein
MKAAEQKIRIKVGEMRVEPTEGTQSPRTELHDKVSYK